LHDIWPESDIFVRRGNKITGEDWPESSEFAELRKIIFCPRV